MKTLYMAALAILVIGGLNWGYVGVAGVDLIALLFGQAPALMRTFYTMIALSSIYVGFCNLIWPYWVEHNILNLNPPAPQYGELKREWTPL